MSQIIFIHTYSYNGMQKIIGFQITIPLVLVYLWLYIAKFPLYLALEPYNIFFFLHKQ